MAFQIGDLVTGTVDNKYKYTGRGAICRVVGRGRDYDDDDRSIIRVEIIGFDDDMLRDGSSIMVSDATRRELVKYCAKFPVKACLFEPYHLYVEDGSVCELHDFLNEM